MCAISGGWHSSRCSFAGEAARGENFAEEIASLLQEYTAIMAETNCSEESEVLLRFHISDPANQYPVLRKALAGRKGGFVSVPVVLAAKHCKIPCIIHESDITPGLANKLAIPSATKVCANFPETLNYLPKEKAVLTGSPIRKELFTGNKIKGLDFCGFTANKPVLLVIGGSTGAAAVNNAIRDLLPTLLQKFQIIHLCGKGKTDESYNDRAGYVQYEYINEELKDLFAAADVIVSRAGANAICELLALKKPNVLIPLSAAASRGDQILNAESFERQGFSYVLKEEDVTNETLLSAITEVYENRESFVAAMNESKLNHAIETITSMIVELSK